jgi:26S proteasome regulatory subunit N5
MSDGQVLKPDKDFSKEVDKQLPEAESLALVFRADLLMFQLKLILFFLQTNVQGALEKLTALEKQTRQVIFSFTYLLHNNNACYRHQI